jgi:AcrR family transcriptional regulator
METLESPRRPRALRLSAAARREHLLDVAASILNEAGFEAFTMEGLAERAGVSKGLGYVYFENADDLALALFDREVARIYQRVEDALSVSASEPFAQRLHRALGAYLDVVLQRGDLLGPLQARFGARWMKRKGRRRIAGFLDFWAQQLRAELALAPDRARTVARMLLAAADACAREWREGCLSRAEAEGICRDFVIGGLNGVRPRGPEPACERDNEANSVPRGSGS